MHVVVADNSRALLDFLRQQIEERGDTVRTFSDGLATRDYIRSNPQVDVLLTSLELVNVSGLELCWDVRVNSDQFTSNYIINMSSSSDVDKLIEALDCGADDYLKKPFLQGELYARLRTAERVLSAQRELVQLATIDHLTGFANRRAFFDNAQGAIENMMEDEPVSVIMLDIDHFKSINDSHGHEVGDNVLRELTQQIGNDCPIFGRLGGEEFAAILVGHSSDEAYQVAEEMRRKIREMTICVGAEVISLSCSFGISERISDEDVDALLKKADAALYEAKRRGRNQTIIFAADSDSIAKSA
jgi:diguanylate cyclase (GGDEF)-like protein